jgi:hypothetical protein
MDGGGRGGEPPRHKPAVAREKGGVNLIYAHTVNVFFRRQPAIYGCQCMAKCERSSPLDTTCRGCMGRAPVHDAWDWGDRRDREALGSGHTSKAPGDSDTRWSG